MNSYIIFIPWYSYKAEADQLTDGLEPDPDSLFGQVRSCFMHLVFAGALNANNADCGFDENGLFIYIESADVFDDDRGQDEGSSLYTAFCRFTEGLFKAAGPEYLETGTGLGSCTLYDRQTNTQWDWDNLDGDFEWVKKDSDPGFLDIIFDRFNDLTKLSLT